MEFSTEYKTILEQIQRINPIEYAQTRNYTNGAVTRLSPYLTHGVIAAKDIVDAVRSRYSQAQSKKLIQELCWREYFQAVHRSRGQDIWSDLRFPQPEVLHRGVPTRLSDIDTGIQAVDDALDKLIRTGYMHNHERMWLAAIVCNHAHYHWKQPSKWLYYHLLDGDIASNTLSWQWVAGSFSSKQYRANQENINEFSETRQPGTFLDVEYNQLDAVDISEAWTEYEEFEYTSELSNIPDYEHDHIEDALIYHPWMLDPKWREDDQRTRILLFDTSHFDEYPISPKRISFILGLTQNINEIKVCKCDSRTIQFTNCISREHPNISHWNLHKDQQNLIVDGLNERYFKNYFSFWKAADITT